MQYTCTSIQIYGDATAGPGMQHREAFFGRGGFPRLIRILARSVDSTTAAGLGGGFGRQRGQRRSGGGDALGRFQEVPRRHPLESSRVEARRIFSDAFLQSALHLLFSA